MSKTLDDYVKRSARAQSAGVREKQAVFEHAYSIALQIADLRKKHRLTQQELAEKVGISQSEISRIERGSLNPTSLTLARVAEALGADVQIVERASRIS